MDLFTSAQAFVVQDRAIAALQILKKGDTHVDVDQCVLAAYRRFLHGDLAARMTSND